VLNKNDPPVFTSPGNLPYLSFSIDENPSLGGTTTPTKAVATDPDVGDVLTFSLETNPGGAYAIHRLTGVISVVKPELFNYEQPGQQPGDIVIAVSDGRLTTTIDGIITVNDANDLPSLSPASMSVAEGAVEGA